MFKQSTKDSINGWGAIFRFITPLILTISLWIMSDIKSDIRDARQLVEKLTIETVTYNTNHLAHHSKFETMVCERLASMETILQRRK